MNGILAILSALIFAPLLPGVINKTKAFFSGKKGPSIFQLYYDILKLIRKGAVYSTTTTFLFKTGPVISLAAMIIVLFLLPLGGQPSILFFPGDYVVLIYFLGLVRFFMILAALDTGSSFEGMGASREAAFSTLCEPVLFVSLAALCKMTGQTSLTGVFSGIDSWIFGNHIPVILLILTAIYIIYLAENARIPVDDPNTHLELTMIHEVMILDHSGPDLAFLLYSGSLKLWIFGSVLSGILAAAIPLSPLTHFAFCIGWLILIGVLTGITESVMARLKLIHIPQLLIAAFSFSVLGILILLEEL
ncbi:MAG: NADH-quinone oxidoreductase subunit H [Candidatus Aureabacteria bacterium]|nr:NADH-quinone oxidoreductase subunit H [Candidatus Auribacterota bacterium]